MRARRSHLARLSAAIVSLVVIALMPVSEWIEQPTSVAIVLGEGAPRQVQVRMIWYDFGLNPKVQHAYRQPDDDGRVTLPPAVIPTTLWRQVGKRILTPIGNWTYCENCYGPATRCTLVSNNAWKCPEHKRVVQNQQQIGSEVQIEVRVITDESSYETKAYTIDNADGLVQEALTLVTETANPEIDPALYGPELKAIQPVRVESRYGVLILWMGGKQALGIGPHAHQFPAISGMMTGGTDHPNIFELSRW
jgi:hypothetical protein